MQADRAKRAVPLPAEEKARHESENKVAIVVGVGSYPPNSGLSVLEFAASDAEELRKVLQRHQYDVECLTDTQATKQGVIEALARVTKRVADTNGTVLFYFSGHGFEADGSNYLATYDSDQWSLKEKGLAVDEIRGLLARSNTKRTAMFVDACRNSPVRGVRGGGGSSFRDFSESSGLWVLNSTRPGGVSYESAELGKGHGVFTYYLLAGLEGNAVGPDALISFFDLASYVTGHMIQRNESTNLKQLPYVGGDFSGQDFYLAGVPAPREKSEPEPPVVMSIVAPSSQGVLNTRDGQHYTWVGPGEFQMGCADSDKYCDDNERPPHSVTLSRGFWMAQTEVTVRAYLRYRDQTHQPPPDTPPFPQGDDEPVVGVSWEGAGSYCNWAGGRLPSEAEWEFAAGRRPFGKQPELADIAWFAENSGRTPLTTEQLLMLPGNSLMQVLRSKGAQTHAVAKLRPATRDSVYDVLGNVWEWCQDGFDRYYAYPVKDPRGNERSVMKLKRGGSWLSQRKELRVSKRLQSHLDARDEYTGFRCVLDKVELR